MMFSLLRPLIFTLPPEIAHHFTLHTLNKFHNFKLPELVFGKIPQLPCTVMGLKFPNPVGLAAGMDKNAEYIDSLATLGFGFIEVGTVTPRPQRGNPHPRLFRLPQAQALINRMGFNNNGVEKLLEHVKKARFNGILGINIGKNFDTPLENAIDDYLIGLHKVYAHADYVAINISSPNTPGLRKLQQEDELERMLAALKKAQQQLAIEYNKYVPLAIKIAPDLNEEELIKIANTLLTYEIDGVIATNTTLSRVGVENLVYAKEKGGLSGAPLLTQATQVVQQLSATLQGKIPIIAVGGVMSVADAQEKFKAGASLVQIYTGLIYRGPGLVKEILFDLKNPD
ncbi:quinone-dependent dihydroorotate dehydrogenase [Candidatus Parabeggiatoa sp. HSG14]|uniref:quinone-dependent dihydroorotate dehydrogenase n=1 Tax=Candidatus Parabeggiatoa sp. HSG14 TaxID=3055593 RepID=UPI0025A8800F|nr:quinone-dependent dihydroorotate dehydrogenase [Thiotrichales bacterium HSG14]